MSFRAIQASYQTSGWQWDLSGEEQPFEETEAYASKRVRDRFDLSRMNRYCRALGIRRDDESYYCPARS